MTKKIEVCTKCGGSNIRQEIRSMVDPNNPPEQLHWEDFIFNDYYCCNDCGDECETTEVNVCPSCIRKDCPVCGGPDD